MTAMDRARRIVLSLYRRKRRPWRCEWVEPTEHRIVAKEWIQDSHVVLNNCHHIIEWPMP